MKIMKILLSCVATLKVEFDEDRRDFDLDEFDGRWVAYFGSSRIIKDRRAYLGLRFTLFASILAIFVWSITVDALAGDLRCWLIYLTHQGLLIVLLFAGQHTSSITSTWLGAMLLSNPEAMAEVKAEQQKAKGVKKTRPPKVRHGDKLW